MRIILFFDLPMTTARDIKNYNTFRRKLIQEGFIMIQESVYCKLALNLSIVKSVKKRLNNIYPPKGNIQILVITEKQFNSIEYIHDVELSNKEDSTDRILVIWN